MGAEPQDLLDQARGGDHAALGELLENYRPYVQVVARGVNNRRLQGRLGDSDLVQDALLEAHRAFANFRGTTLAELTAWLRQIVIASVGHALRAHLGTAKRQLICEATAHDPAHLPADSDSSPSAQAMRHELAMEMANSLARLPDEMQQVLLARHVDDLPYAEIAPKLGRSEAAVRMIYLRALQRLRKEWKGDD